MEAISLNNIGLTLKLKGKETDALKYLNKSFGLFDEIGMKIEADNVSQEILRMCFL